MTIGRSPGESSWVNSQIVRGGGGLAVIDQDVWEIRVCEDADAFRPPLLSTNAHGRLTRGRTCAMR